MFNLSIIRIMCLFNNAALLYTLILGGLMMLSC